MLPDGFPFHKFKLSHEQNLITERFEGLSFAELCNRHTSIESEPGLWFWYLNTSGQLYKTWIKDIQWLNHGHLQNSDNFLDSDCIKNIQIVIQKGIKLDKMLDNFNRALRGRWNEISGILTRSIDSTQPYLHAKIEDCSTIKYYCY